MYPTNPLQKLSWQDVITSFAKVSDAAFDVLESNSEILYQKFLTVEDFENHLAEILDCVILGFSQQKQTIYARGSALTNVRYLHGEEKSVRAERNRIRERANKIIYTIKYTLFPSALQRDRQRKDVKKRKLIEEAKESGDAPAGGNSSSASKIPEGEVNTEPVVMTRREFENQQVEEYLERIEMDTEETGTSSGVSTEISSLSIDDKRIYKGQRSGGHGQVDENGVPLQDLYETPNELVDTIIQFISEQLGPIGILPHTFFDPAVGNGAIIKRLREKGFNDSSGSDKFVCFEGNDMIDFLTLTSIPDGFDFIIVNPPFSQMKEFLDKCFDLRKPFALLARLDILSTKYLRNACFREKCFFCIANGKHLFKHKAEFIDVGAVMWIVGNVDEFKEGDTDDHRLFFY